MSDARWLVVAAMLVGAGLSACSGDDDGTSVGGHGTAAGGTDAAAGSGPQGGAGAGQGGSCVADAPIITSATASTVSDGQAVTLYGCGFGAKSHAAPLRWDSFEDGSDAADVASTGYWTNSGADILFTTQNARHARSQRSVMARLAYGSSNGNFYRLDTWTTPGPKYVSGYLYLDMVTLNTPGDWQVKLIHLLAGAEHADMPVLALQSWWTDTGDVGANGNYYEFNYVDGQWIPSLWDDWVRAGEWVRFEIAFQDSSDASTPDGIANFVAYHADGTVVAGSSGGITQSLAGQFLTTPHFGYALVNVNDGHEVHTYWDDLYLDDSWARVELCDSATYGARSRCEIQIPQEIWRSDEIRIQVNQGAFAPGASAFLYVIASDGTPSASGFPLSF